MIIDLNIYLNLSSSAGIYSNGDGKDLGNALQFKSEVNLFYKLGKSSRVAYGVTPADISSSTDSFNAVVEGTKTSANFLFIDLGI